MKSSKSRNIFPLALSFLFRGHPTIGVVRKHILCVLPSFPPQTRNHPKHKSGTKSSGEKQTNYRAFCTFSAVRDTRCTLHWWSRIGQTKLYKLVNYRCAGTHHLVGTTPIELQRPIVFRHRTAGKNYVVHIPDDFPLVFRL